MKKENKPVYILLFICAIWLVISILQFNVRSINMFIANLLINPVGMILLVKFLNDKRLKAVISIYFFVYGFIFFCYDTYVMIFSRNIIELDTLYLLSNYVMMYIPFKLYNITLKRIINNFLAKRW
tara:strand:+ start:804 stop:1178 length:375 start_codon:yes stop_codon:yes gene_type:complete